MKKLIAGILSLVMVLSLLTGCGNNSDNTANNQGGAANNSNSQGAQGTSGNGNVSVSNGEKTMICASNSDCVTFAPWGQQGGGRKAIRRALYETLTYLNSDGTISYDLAKEITEVSPGVYDITIYDYIYDTAGNHMTASDVVFSFNKAQEAGTYSRYFSNFESIEQTGDYTVRMSFTDEKVGSFYVLFDFIYIVTEAGFEQSGDGMTLNPIGTTSYVLDEYVSGAKIVFKKVDTYWQKEDLIIDALKPNLDSFTWVIITEKAQHAIALESGAIDATNGVTSADYVNFVDDNDDPLDGYGYIESFKTNLLALNFNCSSQSICSDVNLRKAIAYAIDTSAMVHAAYGSAGWAAKCYSSPAFRDYTTSWESDDYFACNVDTAKEYLAKSSYDGRELILLTAGDTEHTTQATLIQAYCEAVGIKVKVEAFDSNLFLSYQDDRNYVYDMTLEFADGSYYTYEIQSNLVDYFENGDGVIRISDSKLKELFNTASSKETASVETMQELLDYLDETCYSVAVGGYTQKVFYNADKIETLGVSSDLFNPNPYNSVLK